MKKLVRVSLLVLAAVALISFVGCKNDSEPEPAPANFVGTWLSPDGAATVSVKDGKFSTEMGPLKLEGTYTVDGNTATTSKVPFPVDEETTVSASFTMKMVDGNDVMKLTVPTEVTQGEPFDMTFVKVSTKKSDLTGTWTGKVVSANNADATIVFADNEATLTAGGGSAVSTNVDQNGNFFTITWQEGNQLNLSEPTTGLISVSGKAWLDDGSVFIKN